MESATTIPAGRHNPFEVLELDATATMRDVTRQKNKLLGMLELGLERAKRYTSSVGDKERTADLVRSAAQELERPRSRLTWELWLEPTDQEVDANPDAAAMQRALVLHHELLKKTAHGVAFGVEELDELGAAWDDVLASGGLYDRIAARASELGIEVDEGEVFDGLCDEIRAQLRTMLEHGPVVDLDAISSEIASEVADNFADRKIELLELACSHLSNTKRQLRRQQQWNGLIREYAASVTGRGECFRHAAFQAVSDGLGNLAVDLFNNDIDHSTALSMFMWLRDEATHLGEEDLVELHRKNAALVQARIVSDEAELHATAHQGPRRDHSRAIVVCASLLLALARLGHACQQSERPYSPPVYPTVPTFYQDLQRYTETSSSPASPNKPSSRVR